MSIGDWGLDLRKRLRLGSTDGKLGDASLAVLLENVPVTLAVIFGSENRFVFANRAYRRAVGHNKTIVGLTVAEALGADAATAWEPILNEVRTSGLPWQHEEVQDAFAGRFWNVYILPLQDDNGQPVAVLSLGLDITAEVDARLQAENSRSEALRNLERLELAVEATDLGMWEWDVQTGKVFWSERQKQIFGLPAGNEPTYEFWRDAIHPEDRDRVLGAVGALMDPASGGRLNLEHRVVRPDGTQSWIVSRGRMIYGPQYGITSPVRLLGTILDATERKVTEETRQLLLREMDHRVKNVFAVADGIVAASVRAAGTPEELAAQVRGRLRALAASHALVRPLVDASGYSDVIAFAELVRTVLKPFADTEHQVLVTGPDVELSLDRASNLALVLHELATNARKYGGFRDGDVAVSWRAECADLVIEWAERTLGGGSPGPDGFGSQLLDRTVQGTLGGRIDREWSTGGLRITISIPMTS